MNPLPFRQILKLHKQTILRLSGQVLSSKIGSCVHHRELSVTISNFVLIAYIKEGLLVKVETVTPGLLCRKKIEYH